MNAAVIILILLLLGLSVYGGLIFAKVLPNPFAKPTPAPTAIRLPAPTTKKA